ncbi:Glutathione transferase [Mycena chlorophos]|uniref:glutathione transferase n=1 Tax=Mycena chlorophos TaxID=658473 RepID=A0A8H6TKL7_MYCCL|nr:Glutathione transferase [Mycena chlorophos]
MVLKLYAPALPIGGALLVAVILNELNIEFEVIQLDLHPQVQEQKGDEFLRMQPFGQVPVIDDDGFILYESRAICRYLVSKYTPRGVPSLLPCPSNIEASAMFEQAASVEYGNFEPHARRVYIEGSLKPRWNIPADQKLLEAAAISLDSTLDVYEKILGKQRYLAGNELTLVDFFHFSFGPGLLSAGYEGLCTQKRPNVKRWWAEMSARPTYCKYGDGWVA